MICYLLSNETTKEYTKRWYREKRDGNRAHIPANIRYEVLRAANGACCLCGATAKDGTLHIDHIRPFSLFPELDLELSNLQVLCETCNIGKSNNCDIDWRN